MWIYRWGPSIHIISVVWLTFTAAIFCLPTVYPITLENCNFTLGVLGAVSFIATLTWLLSARYWFTGPRVDVDNSDAVKTKYWVMDPPRKASGAELASCPPSQSPPKIVAGRLHICALHVRQQDRAEVPPCMTKYSSTSNYCVFFAN